MGRNAQIELPPLFELHPLAFAIAVLRIEQRAQAREVGAGGHPRAGADQFAGIVEHGHIGHRTVVQLARLLDRLSFVPINVVAPHGLSQICPPQTDTHRHRCPLYAHSGQNISAIYTTINGNQSNNCAYCTMKISYFRTLWTCVRV